MSSLNQSCGLHGASGGNLLVITKQRVDKSGNFTTTSIVFVDVTGFSLVMPNKPNGKAIISLDLMASHSVGNSNQVIFRIIDGLTNLTEKAESIANPYSHDMHDTAIVDLTGQTIKIQVKAGGAGTVTVYGTGSEFASMHSMEFAP